MSHLLPTGLFPAPFDTVVPYAAIRGQRSICWTFHEPGMIARNSFDSAWIAVSEVVPMRSEPLRVECQRRFEKHGRWQRDRFTDAAQRHMTGLLVPALSRYGFDRAWTALHLDKLTGRADQADQVAETHRRVAAWYSDQADLTRMVADRSAHIRPLAEPVEVHIPRSGGASWPSPWEPRNSHAQITVDGARVGWLLDDGTLAPDEGGDIRTLQAVSSPAPVGLTSSRP